MIDKQEVLDLAREFGLAVDVVEKDYCLGWVLAGINNHDSLGSQWVFKGGTCLKKCYFETYRFSEDLDFTIIDSGHLDETFLGNAFKQVSEWVYEAAGIELPPDNISFDIYDNPRGNISCQGRLSYRGPLQRRGNLPRIKLDLTADETLVADPVERQVHHPYSDVPENGLQIRSYSFEETFAEKVRAFAERCRPRDLYDVVNIYRHDELRPDRLTVLDVLAKKCEFKGIPVPDTQMLDDENLRAELTADWEDMLAHQLPVLPPFEQYWAEIVNVFDWLHGRSEEQLPDRLSPREKNLDESWQPPPMATAWHVGIPLETIRFAAANRLCVELVYGSSNRLVEPYSLRRTHDGNLLLYAVKHQTGELRSYRVDRIQGAQVTQTPYTPRFRIELTPAGPLFAPPTRRRSASGHKRKRRRR